MTGWKAYVLEKIENKNDKRLENWIGIAALYTGDYCGIKEKKIIMW